MELPNVSLLQLLLGLLAVVLALALLVVVINCVSSLCCAKAEEGPEKELLPEDFLQEIQDLLDRHRMIDEQMGDPSIPSRPHLGSVVTSSGFATRTASPVRMRSRANSGISRTNSEKLQKLKEELEEFRINPDEVREMAATCEKRRRTWGGLQDPGEDGFEALALPEQKTADAWVQTTGTLERARAAKAALEAKIETTV